MRLGRGPDALIAAPAGFLWTAFEPSTHPPLARDLLNRAYADGGAAVRAGRDWWRETEADPEYDPKLCFIAVEAGSGRLAAFAQCWTSGFIKDIAVADTHRGKGLGAALMRRIFQTFQARGCAHVDLKVQVDNPSGAVHFYKSLGMTVVEEL